MGKTIDTLRVFPSLSALVEHASGPSAMRASSRSSRSSGKFDEEFRGTRDWDHALSLVYRWDEGVRNIEAFRCSIMAGAQRSRMVSVPSITPPGVVDVPGVISGDPAAGFIRRVRTNQTTNQRGKVIRIALNVCVSGGVSTDTIMRRGAAVLALVDMLQDKGMRVEITGMVVTGSHSSDSRWEARWTVKRADQRVSLAALAFGLAHPSMLRRIGFSALEVENQETRTRHNVPDGYGKVCESRDQARFEREGIYLSGMHMGTEFRSDDAAREWVRGQVERITSGR